MQLGSHNIVTSRLEEPIDIHTLILILSTSFWVYPIWNWKAAIDGKHDGRTQGLPESTFGASSCINDLAIFIIVNLFIQRPCYIYLSKTLGIDPVSAGLWRLGRLHQQDRGIAVNSLLFLQTCESCDLLVTGFAHGFQARHGKV